MIFLVILLIIIIVWLQYPQNMKDDETNPLYTKIFNFIKIPVIVISFFIIIYLTFGNNIDTKQNLDVYMSIPKY
jgi:hypothetical protein